MEQKLEKGENACGTRISGRAASRRKVVLWFWD
jgi:hypothetical protein